MIVVVTGTGTDVGKTISTAALASALGNAMVLKPLQTGEPEGEGDAPRVEALTGIPTDTLYRYPEPLAPATAARRAGLPYAELAEVAEKIREYDRDDRILFVEGAGGLLVRLGEEWTIADLAKELGAPLVIVCSTGLGSLNEAELTVEAALRRGLRILGLVGGSLPAEPDLATRCNIEDLPAVTKQRVLGYVPEGAGRWSREEFVAKAPQFFAPGALDALRAELENS